MKNRLLNSSVFYTFRGSNMLLGLEKLYENTITNHIIDDSFDYESIDTEQRNFLVVNLSRFFAEYYNNEISENEYTKQGFVFTKKFFDISKKLEPKGFYFILDHVMEADSYVTPELVFFLEKMKEIGISDDRIILAYNNSSDLKGGIVNIRDFKINTLHFPHFFISTLFELSEPTNKTFKKEKDFLILNRRFGLGKYKLLKRIEERGLLNKSIYTILTVLDELDGINTFEPVSLEDDIASVEDVLKDDTYLYRLNTESFFKTKVNVVAETFLENRDRERFKDIIHITEKTWKPIYMGVPFVVSATNKHIETLHKFGFKTFNTAIDEDYDLEEDVNVKLDKIIDSAIKLAELHNTKEVLDTIEYNKTLFKDIEHKRKIVETFFLRPFENIFNINKSII
jgi:hypothetical protein